MCLRERLSLGKAMIRNISNLGYMSIFTNIYLSISQNMSFCFPLSLIELPMPFKKSKASSNKELSVSMVARVLFSN